MNRAFLVAGIAMLMISSQAQADWQYTKWGMTKDQVQKASKGKAAAGNFGEKATGDSPALLSAPYSAQQFTFTAYFHFTKGKLSLIELELDDPEKCPRLIAELGSRYGQTLDQSEFGPLRTAEWRDTKGKNRVTIVQAKAPASSDIRSCTLRYLPLADESSGL